MNKKAFEFLTREDFNLLVENAVELEFQKNDLILEEGSRRQAIFIILAGIVRIVRAHEGKGVAYVQLGPGEIFGEMSFVENEGASASVFADDYVKIQVVEGYGVNSLLASVPGFGTRFYQSLALILAHRLRATSKMIPTLMLDETPTMKKEATSDQGHFGRGDLPQQLIAEALQFRREMLRIDRGLKEREIKQPEAQSRADIACDGIRNTLSAEICKSEKLSKTIGGFVFRETFPFFVLSKLFDRLYTKPRGFSVDYATLELISNNTGEGSGRLGPVLDTWLKKSLFSKAYKNRTLFIRTILDATETRTAQPLMLTSIVAGVASEVWHSSITTRNETSQLHFIDTDPEALNVISKISHEKGFKSRTTVVQENIVRLALGKGRILLPPQDIILFPYLLDYLEDDYGSRVLAWIYSHLKAGGFAVFGSFRPNNPDRLFMEYILDWCLIHRSQENLESIILKSGFSLNQIEFHEDETKAQYMVILKKA